MAEEGPGSPRILILDPYLFLGVRGLDPMPTAMLDDLVIHLLRGQGLKIADHGSLWEDLKREMLRPAIRTVLATRQFLGDEERRFKAAADELLRTRQTIQLPLPPAGAGITLAPAAHELFKDLSETWQARMEGLLRVGAIARRDGADVFLFTRLVRDRNATALPENLRNKAEFVIKEPWRIVAHWPDRTARDIDLICNSRNLVIDWTRRHADDLPAASDGGKFPFYPRADWRDREDAHRTVKSQYAWLDEEGNGWSEPAARSTSAALVKHFDVQLTRQVKTRYRIQVPYLNIRRRLPSAHQPADGKRPGDIDHVSGDYANQEERLMKHPGWKR